MKKDYRATWRQAIATFLSPILILLTIRWLLVEPFVIPSGSMIPNLLIHDHIFVNKLSYGVNWPWTKQRVWQWSQPSRGDVVVFRYPENPEVFFIKRVIGLPGDEIAISKGKLYVNSVEIHSIPTVLDNHIKIASKIFQEDTDFHYFLESSRSYLVRYLNKDNVEYEKIKVPAGSYFMMGDNRDQSSDSRVWGFVPEANLIGQAKWIWLSCEETMPSANFICNPQTIRWNRIFSAIK